MLFRRLLSARAGRGVATLTPERRYGRVQPLVVPADFELVRYLLATRRPASSFTSQPRLPPRGARRAAMFFFSNRMGCLGSILVSIVGTLLLLVLLGVIRLF